MIKNKFKRKTSKFESKVWKSITEIKEAFPGSQFYLFKLKNKKHLYYVELIKEDGDCEDLYIDKNFDIIIYR